MTAAVGLRKPWERLVVGRFEFGGRLIVAYDRRGPMVDWIPNLPVVLIALVALVGMALLTLAIYALVMRLAESERAEDLQALSPGMLPPMGILFALIVGFLAVGVWGNVDRAEEVISDEASALRSVVILSDDLPQTSACKCARTSAAR